MELKKMPKVVGCIACEFRTDEPKEIELFRANGCPNCERFEYKGTFSFKSDQALTFEQLDQIVFAIQVQMEEPVDAEGNDVEFSTREVLVSLEVSE